MAVMVSPKYHVSTK